MRFLLRTQDDESKIDLADHSVRCLRSVPSCKPPAPITQRLHVRIVVYTSGDRYFRAKVYDYVGTYSARSLLPDSTRIAPSQSQGNAEGCVFRFSF